MSTQAMTAGPVPAAARANNSSTFLLYKFPHLCSLSYLCKRWDGRVAERGGLENHWAGNGPGGSNPSPTAIFPANLLGLEK